MHALPRGHGQGRRADGRAQFIAVHQRAFNQAAPQTPLWLNSGRLRDQWHSMTRTGEVASLMQHRPEPFVTLHPADAALYGLSEGELVQLSNASGCLLLRVEISDNQRPGELFIPMHWSAQFASQARADVLFAADTDAKVEVNLTDKTLQLSSDLSPAEVIDVLTAAGYPATEVKASCCNPANTCHSA